MRRCRGISATCWPWPCEPKHRRRSIQPISYILGELKVNLWDHIGIIVPLKRLKDTCSTTKMSSYAEAGSLVAQTCEMTAARVCGVWTKLDEHISGGIRAFVLYQARQAWTYIITVATHTQIFRASVSSRTVEVSSHSKNPCITTNKPFSLGCCTAAAAAPLPAP